MRDSVYLLTNLYRTDFFSRAKPTLIAAYLIPFKDGSNLPYEDSPEGLKRKQDDIERNLLGVAANYASQGFTFGLLYEPHITFPYYYTQLEKLDAHIRTQSLKDARSGGNYKRSRGIESKCLSRELGEILSKPRLYFKKDHEVCREDREILRKHLSRRGNRFVLAELLYYITSRVHCLPAVNEQYFELMRGGLPARPLAKNTVPMRQRRYFDEDAAAMRGKLAGTRTFQLLCYSGSSFLGADGATGTAGFFPLLLERLRQNPPMKIEVILGRPASSGNSLSGIKMLRKQGGASVRAKTTKLFLPYSINIYRFFDSTLDYLKLDLYSPYISDNGQRPSVIIFRIAEPDLFDHFENIFTRVWNDEDNSSFV